MKKYNFEITDPKNLDFSRILAENEGSDALIVLASQDREHAILCLSVEFLGRFCPGDKLGTAGELLCPEWGLNNTKKLNLDLKWSSVWKATKGWKNTFILREKIPETIKELSAAREFRRKIKITVLQP